VSASEIAVTNCGGPQTKVLFKVVYFFSFHNQSCGFRSPPFFISQCIDEIFA
jgi:hypothetical protein